MAQVMMTSEFIGCSLVARARTAGNIMAIII
jgi:hypothetical protein